MRRALLLALVLAAGCSRRVDPMGRMAAGTRAVLVNRPGQDSKSIKLYRSLNDDPGVPVPIGTPVVVLDDRVPQPPNTTVRLIRVRVEDGEHRGAEGTVGRDNLKAR